VVGRADAYGLGGAVEHVRHVLQVGCSRSGAVPGAEDLVVQHRVVGWARWVPIRVCARVPVSKSAHRELKYANGNERKKGGERK
jgi:hypothetical protein